MDTGETAISPVDADDEEEEEEKSLLMDHPPSIPPASQLHAKSDLEEPKGPQSRLVIHKLALVNFKSYAGRQEIGPFHKSFSSIVGANGSGKSNTIDALLFVFGYRASKMRQGKLSELIHNSARHPDLNQCSVEVYFREIIDRPGPDAFDIVPESNLVVGRHAYKDNTSTYTINGRSSSYKEVQSLLKGRGIDLDHKRFLILQGEVESIAQMKPKGGEHDEGLLEYLEDIIGTSKYKEPIETAFADLENLQESRQEKLNRLRLVEREKNSLEDKKKEAEEYLRLQNELVRAQSKLYQWYIWQTLHSENKIRALLEKAEGELDQEKAKNKDDIEHLEELQADYKAYEKGYKEVQKLVTEAVQSLSEHEKQEIGLSEKRKHAAGKAKKLKKSVGDARTALKTAQHAIEDSEEKLKKEKKNLENYEESLGIEEKVLEEIQDSLRDKTQKFYDQKEALQKDLQPWTAKINAKQTEIDVAGGERDALLKKVEHIQTALEEAEEHLEKVKLDQEEKIKLIAETKGEKAELNSKKETITGKLNKAQESEQCWRTKSSSSHQRVLEAKASQAETRSQGKVLESLTRMQDTGRITGFHGRLGSLGTIPEKYDVAITTACPSLNNMVVDTVKQGQECLEYLRSNTIGRATFMVLEKISFHSSVLSPPSTPENVPRLFDLITPKDTKFAEVFYKAVGDTLVAKDIDQANRIAFGERRTKVVTLAGQVIETSGAMSGGGGAPAKGGMSAKLAKDSVSPRQLQEFEQERDQAQSKLEEAIAMVRSAEAELEQLNRSGPEIDLRYAKLGLDIQQGKSRIEEAEKRLKNLVTHSKPDQNDVTRIQNLEDNISRFKVDIRELKEKAGEIEASLQEVEDKIMKIGGSKLMAQKSKVEGLRNHINLTNDSITNAEVTKAKAEKDVDKHQHTVDSDAAALEQLESELAELDGQLGELSGFVKTVKAKVEAAEAAEESKREALAERKAQLETKTEAVEAFRQTEIKLQKAIDGHQKEIDRISTQVEHYRALHDALTLEDVGDDEGDEEGDEEGEADQGESAHQKHEDDEEDIDVNPIEPPKDEAGPNKLHVYKTLELQKFKERDMRVDVQALEDQIKRAKPNLNVLEEYKRREAEFLSRHDDLEKVVALRDAQKKKYEDLRKQRLEEFMAGFSTISLKLKEMYQAGRAFIMITQGGNAELELVDSMDPFAEGIIFSVMPPKKSWKNISNLSGGEKTLSSLALVFALHVFKASLTPPTPLYFMDEIDAALDFRNVSIIANYIKDRTKNAQFIIISLRNDMFELSHRLIGIYKTANVTQSISIDNHALTARPVYSDVASTRTSL
ncbi:RecF/RecN/SMC [Lentinula aciculospora]|uniref:Structural maintenance of chromosomes protein n=1 Tax=Lentinula aciculospora TaxID=153920 RepID=A0A9W9ATG8_9AGAR|nr:RecF/RecN/SMC [Lentinula aciculospora]